MLKTVTTTHPNDFVLLGNVWTTPLLAEYINQNYGIKYSNEYIRLKLKANNFSFKRAQRKATKANKDSQKAFKKMNTILIIVKNSSDCMLYAMDETLLRAESDNSRTWSPVGISPILEHNGSHKGINIIGTTEITKNFDTIIDAYEAKHSITFLEIQTFMENLLERNTGKKVFLILDNAKSHNCKKIQEFANAHKNRLSLIIKKIYGID